MKLLQLFIENLEKKVKRILKTRSGKITEPTIRILNTADPTDDEAIYTPWLVTQYTKGRINIDHDFEDRNSLYEQLKLFHKNKRKLPVKNIDSLTRQQLFKMISDFNIQQEGVKTTNYDILLKGGNKLVKNVPPYKLVEINSYDGMSQFKSHSKTVPTDWCIAFPNMFYSHIETGNMFLILKNDKPYVFIDYEGDEFKLVDNTPISPDEYSFFKNLGFIDESRVLFGAGYVDSGPFPVDLNIALKNPGAAIKYVIDHSDKAKPYLDKLEALISSNPNTAYIYAFRIIKGRWPRGEEAISKDPEYAYFYAKNTIKGRWPKAEEIISKDPEGAYFYAADVIKGRWPKAEEIISKDPEMATFYATDVIKGRWPKGEPAIFSRPRMSAQYKKFLNQLQK